MSTTPTPAPTTTTSWWDKFKTLFPAIEMAGNIALLASPLAAIEPLVAQLENATNPLIQSLGNQNPPQQEIMLFYSTAIGVLTTLKQTPGLPADTLAKVNDYITAAEAGTAGAIQAQSGFNPASYTPVTPIQ